MLEKLKKKWEVSGYQLLIILIVFAIAGTTTAFLTRQITQWLNLDNSSFYYWLLKIGVLLIGYWIVLLMVSIPFGQFRFFKNFARKTIGRLFRSSRPASSNPRADASANKKA